MHSVTLMGIEQSIWKVAFLVFVFYWGLCRTLRWRRITATQNKFKGRDPYSLTVDEAQSIVKQVFNLEMPYMARFASAFALFRTYGITTIANILLK
jgi:phosphatidylglycerophosphatase A